MCKLIIEEGQYYETYSGNAIVRAIRPTGNSSFSGIVVSNIAHPHRVGMENQFFRKCHFKHVPDYVESPMVVKEQYYKNDYGSKAIIEKDQYYETNSGKIIVKAINSISDNSFFGVIISHLIHPSMVGRMVTLHPCHFKHLPDYVPMVVKGKYYKNDTPNGTGVIVLATKSNQTESATHFEGQIVELTDWCPNGWKVGQIKNDWTRSGFTLINYKEKEETNTMEKQQLTRQGLKEIYAVACPVWQAKLLQIGTRNPLEDFIELTDEEVDSMFKEAQSLQLPVVEKHLKRNTYNKLFTYFFKSNGLYKLHRVRDEKYAWIDMHSSNSYANGEFDTPQKALEYISKDNLFALKSPQEIRNFFENNYLK